MIVILVQQVPIAPDRLIVQKVIVLADIIQPQVQVLVPLVEQENILQLMQEAVHRVLLDTVVQIVQEVLNAQADNIHQIMTEAVTIAERENTQV